ncbi:MAG: exodeoxyribonuclease V subunit alpha [Oxalobacter sp.]|nr:MAG: exodeoxyribonuclease V subunit alpha [Oxalobacter sp.]
MMANDILSIPETFLMDGFADHLVAWAVEAGAPRETLTPLRQLAREICASTSEGHVCMALNEVCTPDALSQTRKLLLSTLVVGTPDAPGLMPLILDEENRLYLHRYYDYEVRLARRLLFTQASTLPHAPAVTLARLNTFFGKPVKNEPIDWPRIAAALALHGKLLIISGGPGTGKTTTIVNLLACLLEDNPDCRIALTAPTGKAAARMQETVRDRAAHLPQNIQSRLPTESFTIHRLLGATSGKGDFRYHAKNPLPVDAVIVDEASMLDISLATQLFEAIPTDARIILLGDKDQLSAVEAGAVFSELSADPTLTPDCKDRLINATGMTAQDIAPQAPRKTSGLQDCVVWFTRQYRFASDSAISQLARHVSHGNAESAIALLQKTSGTELQWIDDQGKAPSEHTSDLMIKACTDYLQAVMTHPADTSLVFDAFDRFRVLCAVKDGPRGVDAINRLMDRYFRLSLNDPRYASERMLWYPGRPVIVLRNDYVLKLFNGDIGITLMDRSQAAAQPMVYFPDKEKGFRAIAPARLPEHETAFAMSVHKSQGSEFDSLLLIMPEMPTRVCTRELLYTAITRARNHVAISANENVLKQSIASQTHRNSGLASRIKEAAKASFQ